MRPGVWHNYNHATKKLDRELAYTTTDFKDLKSSAIADTLAKTKWPMGQFAVHFVWDGPASPFYLQGPAMRQQAEKWGIKVDATTSHQRLQPLVVARAVAEYEQRFMAVVNAAWHAACAAAKPDDQPTTTTGSASTAEPTKAGEQPTAEPTKAGDQPMAEQPKEAEAQPSASSL